MPKPAVNKAVAELMPISSGTSTVAPNATNKNCTPTIVRLATERLSVYIIILIFMISSHLILYRTYKLWKYGLVHTPIDAHRSVVTRADIINKTDLYCPKSLIGGLVHRCL